MKLIYHTLFILLILSCSEKKSNKKENLNQIKLEKKTYSIENGKLQQHIKSMEVIALSFINNYVENCNKTRDQIDVQNWVSSNPNSSEILKSDLNKIIEKAERENPGYGLGFDPIFNAQDYPDNGFELIGFDTKNGLVRVKGKDMDGFKMEIQLVLKKNKWLVNGIGIINNNDPNHIEKTKRYKRMKKYIINDKYIGDLYVEPLNDSIFKSLIIINKLDTIYKIHTHEFWNKKGLDFRISNNSANFYGYSLALINEKSFVLNYYTNGGRNIGDNLTIIWNNDNKLFEIMLAP